MTISPQLKVTQLSFYDVTEQSRRRAEHNGYAFTQDQVHHSWEY